MKLDWQLATRFRSSRHQSGFVSFISASSTLGIGLGCFVLILLLSVMNGFEKELKERLLSVIPHGQIWSVGANGVENWQQEIARLSETPGLNHIEPYTQASGMLQKAGNNKAVDLTAIAPQYTENSQLHQRIDAASWQRFTQNTNRVLLGTGVMQALDFSVGDKVQLLLPQLSDDLSLKAPKILWLEVAGSVSIGGEVDNHLGFMHLAVANEAMGVTTGAQGLKFQFEDPFVAPMVMRQIGYGFAQHVYMSDWTRTQGHLYQDIQLVRVLVYLVLTLVIAVACFNIVSTLVMAVNEKQSEIAMLMTMGADKSLITRVFIIQGCINGIIGTAIGVSLGVWVAMNLSSVARAIEGLVGVQFLSGDIYFIDFLPSDLRWHEVLVTAAIALTLSFVATIYPAHKAAGLHPAHSLGHK